MKRHPQIPGALVSLPLPGRQRPLDGFWVRSPRRSRTLLVIVHGMHSNFYRSEFKKELMRQAPRGGMDVLSFDTRGAGEQTAGERFSDCLADLDAAYAFGRAHGYRRFVLLGHSTGCQKITYWQYKRRRRNVALVLAAIGDDLAIARRDLGLSYRLWLRKARHWVAKGRADRPLPARCLGFTAARFLSVADPRKIESRLFNLRGPMREFRALRCPILALCPENEQYACLPVPRMMEILREKTRSPRFAAALVPRADHSFRLAEAAACRMVLTWIDKGGA